jgi:hypothetical protein
MAVGERGLADRNADPIEPEDDIPATYRARMLVR